MSTREDIIKNRVIKSEDFMGKRYTPSISVRTLFLKLFLLMYVDFNKKFLIQNIFWDTDSFRLVFNHSSTSNTFEVLLQDNKGTHHCGGRLCTSNICTGIHDSPRDPDFLAFLIAFREHGKHLTLNLLLKFLVNDNKAKKEYYQVFAKPSRPPFSIIQDWGNPIHRIRFIAHEGVFRNIGQSLEINTPNIHIQHSERECLGIGPEIAYHKEYKFFNFPREYYDHTYDKYFYLSREERSKYIDSISGKPSDAFTDLDEEDIIMGKGTKKLQDTLDIVVERINKEDIKMLSFNCCCVPRIVGDDIFSVLERTKKKIDIPFIFQGQLEKTPFEQNIGLIESYLSKIDANSLEKEETSIVLFGYHENKYLHYLSDILVSAGIRIRAIFIPTIDIRILSMLYRASLFVFSSNRFQEEIFEYPFRTIGTKSISPKYPYGIENTKKWLSSVYDSFGMKYSISDTEQKLLSVFDTHKENIQRKKYSIGIVCIGMSELLRFLDSDYMNNVDVVGCLSEMGFKINFFVYDSFESYTVKNNEQKFHTHEGDHDKIADIISKKLQDSDHSTIFFSTEQEMYSSISESGVRAIYSDIYFDERLAGLGIAQFNIRQFNIGYQGAIDGIREMLHLCEMKYPQIVSKYSSNNSNIGEKNNSMKKSVIDS